MRSRFNIAALIIAALVMAVPTASFARNGADNPPGDTSGGGGGGGGQWIKARGTCSAASKTKIKVKLRSDGRLKAEFEVDENVVGATWDVTMTDNGQSVFSGTATTTADSGSFDVERKFADQAGTDSITGTATNPATGETCSATVSI